MCADPNAGARAAARERQQQKVYDFKQNSTKFWNQETDYIIGTKKAATGYSRDISDIQQAYTRVIGETRAGWEDIARQQFRQGFVDEGGSSRNAGRAQAAELFAKKADLDRKLYEFGTAGVAQAERGALLRKRSFEKKNRARLGLPPEFGQPVTMPPKDTMGMFLNATSFALNTVSSLAALSDIRLKENVEQVDTSPDGYKVYEFNYKGDDTRYRGAMAQDVVKKNPMAVGIHKDYLTVDYSKIDVDMEVVY